MLPPSDDGAFDETVTLLVPLGRRSVAVTNAFSGAFVFDIADRKPQKLHCRLIIREMTTILDDLAELIVQRLDGVGGVDNFADGRRERQKRNEAFPGCLPGPNRSRVLLPQADAANSCRAISAASMVGAV